MKVLHGDVERAVLQLSEVENLNRIGVRKARNDARLLLKSLLQLLVQRYFRSKDLEGEHLTHSHMLDLVHRAHSAFAELFLQPIAAVDQHPGPRPREGGRVRREPAQIIPAPRTEVGTFFQGFLTLRTGEGL